MRRFLSVFLVAVLFVGLAGCGAVGDIAGEVADAAVQKLEEQLKETLEKNKVELVEMKTAIGKLNDQGGKLQFFCAALVRVENTDALEVCRKVLSSVFEQTGMTAQTEQALSSEYLVHKSITFDHADFSAGNYYVVYGYMGSLLTGSAESGGNL